MTNKELQDILSAWPDNYKIDIYLGYSSDNIDIKVDTIGKVIRLFEPAITEQLPEALQTPEQTPEERRNAGQPFCPKCSTFGHSHSKGCPFANSGMKHHVTRI